MLLHASKGLCRYYLGSEVVFTVLINAHQRLSTFINPNTVRASLELRLNATLHGMPIYKDCEMLKASFSFFFPPNVCAEPNLVNPKQPNLS